MARESAPRLARTLGGWPGRIGSGPGKGGRLTWQHGQVWKRRQLRLLCGALAHLRQGEESRGARGRSRGSLPGVVSDLLPDSQYRCWFRAAMNTKRSFRVVIAPGGARAGGLTTS
jgi:hypothetical protein